MQVRRVSEMSMPDALEQAVAVLNQGFRATAIENWIDIGDDGRDAYRKYLDRAWTRRSREKRLKLAAMQLCHPDIGFTNGSSPTA